jgi:hypothetical protein
VPPELPCTKALKRALEHAKAGLGYAPLPSRPILCTPSGGTMGYRYIADLMLRERKRLGMEAFDLHALRYRGVMELAWAGCDDDQIASYSRHTTKAMIAKYAGEGSATEAQVNGTGTERKPDTRSDTTRPSKRLTP